MPYNDARLDAVCIGWISRTQRQRLVNNRFQIHNFRTTAHGVGGNDDICTAVQNATGKRRGREAGELNMLSDQV
jgi:hypothetical protein